MQADHSLVPGKLCGMEAPSRVQVVQNGDAVGMEGGSPDASPGSIPPFPLFWAGLPTPGFSSIMPWAEAEDAWAGTRDAKEQATYGQEGAGL